jgi:hypothetical protein
VEGSARTIRGRVAVAGIGETQYYRRGESPDAEFVLACRAILAACEDAGVGITDVDGFASYSNDRNEPSRLAAALGLKELRLSNMQWGHGGGGVAAAVANTSAAIVAGLAVERDWARRCGRSTSASRVVRIRDAAQR